MFLYIALLQKMNEAETSYPENEILKTYSLLYNFIRSHSPAQNFFKNFFIMLKKQDKCELIYESFQCTLQGVVAILIVNKVTEHAS